MIELLNADAREVDLPAPGCLIVDPPWDDPELVEWAAELYRRETPPSTLVFTGPRHLGRTIELFGPPRWSFVWDTVNTWSTGKTGPLERHKLALHYGDRYDRDAGLFGSEPSTHDHAGRETLAGRRLSDVYARSLRWLHHPAQGADPGEGSTSDRFKRRRADPALRHAKPIEWVRCLIACTDPDGGTVVDPFAGSGTSLIAARQLDRPAFGVELDPDTYAYARHALDHETRLGITSQPRLF